MLGTISAACTTNGYPYFVMKIFCFTCYSVLCHMERSRIFSGGGGGFAGFSKKNQKFVNLFLGRAN